MNQEWSEKNKTMQKLLSKKATFSEGIETLLSLREDLWKRLIAFETTYPREAFSRMPFPKAEGYHSKTLAYTVWHIFRIEDIVANTMIGQREQVFFAGNYREKIGSRIITTGNELKGEEICRFSESVDLEMLYAYAAAVKESTDELLKTMEYPELKRKFGESDREQLWQSGCVSREEEAAWLVDYWCGKTVEGLIRMPFSRHWIMHTEAMLRIAKALEK